MDISIRRHEHCVIGQPSCDYVFSSTRSCFIAYGFRENEHEIPVLLRLLEARGVEPVAAGEIIAPATNVFCTKICSKILTAQFCIVLFNNQLVAGVELPKPNVAMEYGMMLGFNKLVVPFQRDDQTLPFDAAPLDTLRYGADDFEAVAGAAIDHAIAATTRAGFDPTPVDQVIASFLLLRGAIPAIPGVPVTVALESFARPLGFLLYSDFAAMKPIFVGNFLRLRAPAVAARLRRLEHALAQRREGVLAMASQPMPPEALKQAQAQAQFAVKLIDASETWVLVNTEREKAELESLLALQPPAQRCSVVAMSGVRAELEAAERG